MSCGMIKIKLLTLHIIFKLLYMGVEVGVLTLNKEYESSP
jgi:hypothetical protein